LTVHNAVPDTEGVLVIVNADGYKSGIERVELFGMLRELAQLARAVRSPVSSIKNQEDAPPSHLRETNRFSMLILECKTWRRLALSRSDLGLGQDLLRECKR
jgi:hypothetical protein